MLLRFSPKITNPGPSKFVRIVVFGLFVSPLGKPKTETKPQTTKTPLKQKQKTILTNSFGLDFCVCKENNNTNEHLRVPLGFLSFDFKTKKGFLVFN